MNEMKSIKSENVDKRGRLEEEVFSYRISKDKKVFLYWNQKEIKILRGADSEKFLERIKDLTGVEAQLVMAKATGNFKHGNERSGK